MTRETIGHRIRTLRKAREISQATAAETLGLGQVRLSRIEHGASDLPARMVAPLAKLLGADERWLVGNPDAPEPDFLAAPDPQAAAS